MLLITSGFYHVTNPSVISAMENWSRLLAISDLIAVRLPRSSRSFEVGLRRESHPKGYLLLDCLGRNSYFWAPSKQYSARAAEHLSSRLCWGRPNLQIIRMTGHHRPKHRSWTNLRLRRYGRWAEGHDVWEWSLCVGSLLQCSQSDLQEAF